MDGIVKKEDPESIHFIIDHNDLAKDRLVADIAEMISKSSKREVTAENRRSADAFSLQTNDFAVGAMGKKYNRGEDHYISRIKAGIEIIIITNETEEPSVNKRKT